MAFGVTFEVDKASLKKAMDSLEALPKKRIRPAVRQGVNAAGREVVKRAKPLAARDTGALRRAIKVRMWSQKETRRKGLIMGTVTAENKKQANGRNPGNYAHLIEAGHRIAIGGKLTRMRKKKLVIGFGTVGGFVPGTRFMSRASVVAHGSAVNAFVQKLRAAVEKYGNA